MKLTLQLVVFASLVGMLSAHRGMLTRGSCDSDFASSASALVCPDIEISWSFKHYLDCTSRAVWVTFTNPAAGFQLYVGHGVPPLPRFEDQRSDALIIGPGLPPLSAEDMALVPQEVLDDPAMQDPANGAVLYRSPADQSTCAHLGTVMNDASTVRNGRCDFYEPFGSTHSWRTLDANDIRIPVAAEAYFVASWLQEHTSGKLGIALGTWVENFWAPYDIATPSCTRNLADFSEKGGNDLRCFPVEQCDTLDTPISKTECEARGKGAECPAGVLCSSQAECEPYDMSMGCGGQACPAALELWDRSMMAMHQGMAIAFTGDAAVDFVRGMIPHHEGAVDMCDVLLRELECVGDEDAFDGLVHFCNHVRWEQGIEVGGMRAWLAEKALAEAAPCTAETPFADACQHGGNWPYYCTEDEARAASSAGSAHDEGGLFMPNAAADVWVHDGSYTGPAPLCTCAGITDGSGAPHDHDHGDHSDGHGDHSDGDGEHGHMEHGEHGMWMGCGDTESASSKLFMEANMAMHDGMAIKFSCNHGVDFVKSMIPHHAGAIAMCDILAAHDASKDPYLAELCSNITHTQRAEIMWMSEWLVARGQSLAAPCEACETGALVMPPMPCEDVLPTTSFCHLVGGDGSCKCEALVAEHPCGTSFEPEGFGAKLVVDDECRRTCGHCPDHRAPLFHQFCQADDTEAEGEHSHHDHDHDHDHDHGHDDHDDHDDHDAVEESAPTDAIAGAPAPDNGAAGTVSPAVALVAGLLMPALQMLY